VSRFEILKPLKICFALSAAFLGTACGGGGGTGTTPTTPIGAVPVSSNAPNVPSSSPLPTESPTPPGAPGPYGHIKHVVIIIQENRSTDNLFNGFPGADTARTGRIHTGQVVNLQPQPLAASIDPCHLHDCFETDYDNGNLDGFDVARADGMTSYSYVQQSDIQPYWTLAQTYGFADRMFQDDTGPSFPAHLYLISGQSAGIDGLPFNNSQNDPHLWSCAALPTTFVTTLLSNGQAGPNVPPCVDYETLADDLEMHGHTWRSYAPAIGNSGFIWSAYSAVKHIFENPTQWANVVSPETTVLTDAAAGNLPDVTWVTPSAVNSDHAGMGYANGGPDWVASIANAIGNGPLWSSTAIFVTWDDWGGYYDHVVPPQIDYMGLSFRVPLIVISPYAKRGYVSHYLHDFGSILHFAEEATNVPSLGGRDATADDLSDMFDFSQTPTTYQSVRTKLRASDFLRQPRSDRLPDDE
jgi:phospholipase C